MPRENVVNPPCVNHRNVSASFLCSKLVQVANIASCIPGCRTAFYGQYKCFGPGANEAGRAAWSHELTDAQAAPFLSLGYVDGSLWVTEA